MSRARFSFHHSPHQCQVSGPHPHFSVLSHEGAVVTPHCVANPLPLPDIPGSLQLTHPNLSLFTHTQNPFLQLSLPQCPSGRHPTATMRPPWIRSLRKMQIRDTGSTHPLYRWNLSDFAKSHSELLSEPSLKPGLIAENSVLFHETNRPHALSNHWLGSGGGVHLEPLGPGPVQCTKGAV